MCRNSTAITAATGRPTSTPTNPASCPPASTAKITTTGQADAVTHQHRRQQVALDHLPYAEHDRHAHQRHDLAELYIGGNCRGGDAHDSAQVGHDTGQARDGSYQHRDVQPDNRQAHRVDRAQRQHDHELSAQECPDHLVTFPRQLHRLVLPVLRQQAQRLRCQPVPVAQHVKGHYRDQHQIAKRQQQVGTGAGDVAADGCHQLAHGLPVAGECLLDLQCRHRFRRQVQGTAHPGKDASGQPVIGGGNTPNQDIGLVDQQWQQDQQATHEENRQHQKHHHHRCAAPETPPLQPVGDGVAQIGQQPTHHEGRQDGAQLEY